MNLPTKIVTGEKVRKRWSIDDFDLFWLIFNYDLRPVDLNLELMEWQYREWSDDENNYDVVADLYLNMDKNLSGLSFKIEDIEKFEAKVNSRDRVKGSDLMKRWDVTEDELLDLLMQGKIQTADALGEPFPLSDYPNFILHFGINLSDLRFDLSKIEAVDNEFGYAGSGKPRQKVDREETKPQRNKRKVCEIAKRKWDENPSMTIEEMTMDDEITIAAGKNYYPGTLRKWIKDLCPDRKPGRRPKKSW
jgi:hypothetical protein